MIKLIILFLTFSSLNVFASVCEIPSEKTEAQVHVKEESITKKLGSAAIWNTLTFFAATTDDAAKNSLMKVADVDRLITEKIISAKDLRPKDLQALTKLLNKNTITKISVNGLKIFARVSGVGSAGAAGYSVGELIVAVDKNKFDGRLVSATGVVLEPVFAEIYSTQQRFSTSK